MSGLEVKRWEEEKKNFLPVNSKVKCNLPFEN